MNRREFVQFAALSPCSQLLTSMIPAQEQKSGNQKKTVWPYTRALFCKHEEWRGVAKVIVGTGLNVHLQLEFMINSPVPYDRWPFIGLPTMSRFCKKPYKVEDRLPTMGYCLELSNGFGVMGTIKDEDVVEFL